MPKLEKQYRGVVQKVFPHGSHGPYAKARVENLGTVTFSLTSPVWEEETFPEEGVWVIMTRLRRKRAGWRAEECRFLRPEDELATATK